LHEASANDVCFNLQVASVSANRIKEEAKKKGSFSTFLTFERSMS
jgi:hypothetical protein